MNTIYTMGIDIGSTASKCVILEDGKKIVALSVEPFGAGTGGPGRAIAAALDESGLKREDLACVLATGYGRTCMAGADYEMSELSCHAKGAHYLFSNVGTVIDIGGQDIKILRVGENGALENFVMNEKCAAGTGRFLEVMARVLEVDIDDMSTLSAKSTQRVDISSTCTVFAESEVISQLAQNRDKCDIIAGIHRSVAGRVSGMARRMGIRGAVVMTGGVSRNGGVLCALEEELGTPILTSPLSQYAGALGAAILARGKIHTPNPYVA